MTLISALARDRSGPVSGVRFSDVAGPATPVVRSGGPTMVTMGRRVAAGAIDLLVLLPSLAILASIPSVTPTMTWSGTPAWVVGALVLYLLLPFMEWFALAWLLGTAGATPGGRVKNLEQRRIVPGEVPGWRAAAAGATTAVLGLASFGLIPLAMVALARNRPDGVTAVQSLFAVQTVDRRAPYAGPAQPAAVPELQLSVPERQLPTPSSSPSAAAATAPPRVAPAPAAPRPAASGPAAPSRVSAPPVANPAPPSPARVAPSADPAGAGATISRRSSEDAELTRVSSSSTGVVICWDTGHMQAIQGTAVLGRRPVCDDAGETAIVVEDPDRSVSKTHARVSLGSDGIWVEDLGSTNGTRVVQRGARPVAVTPGSRVLAHVGDQLWLGERQGRLAVLPTE